MDLCNELCLSSWPGSQPSCVVQTLKLDIMCKLFNQFFFFFFFILPTLLISTIGFYHFVPLSLTLTLPGGHKVISKQNLLDSFSPTLFI